MTFEPAWAHGLVGGVLIGLASAIFMLGNGRIAGMSGITLSTFTSINAPAGRISAAFLVAAFATALAIVTWIQPVTIVVTESVGALVLSGLLVGAGVTVSDGCTSGHGVCGMSRLSVRSLVATATFMFAAAVSVYIVQHLLGRPAA